MIAFACINGVFLVLNTVIDRSMTGVSTGKSSEKQIEIRLHIDGKQGWQDSGLIVPAHSQLGIQYIDGKWTSNIDGAYVDAGGYPGTFPRDIKGFCGKAPLPDAPNMALIGRVGDGEPFLVGWQATFVTDQAGRLLLRPNDADACLGDNDGTIVISIFY